MHRLLVLAALLLAGCSQPSGEATMVDLLITGGTGVTVHSASGDVAVSSAANVIVEAVDALTVSSGAMTTVTGLRVEIFRDRPLKALNVSLVVEEGKQLASGRALVPG